jgi:hypothetical protein
MSYEVEAVRPVGASKPQRVIYRTLCEECGAEYGRELVPSTPQHESYLIGNCPCREEKLRIRLAWEEKVNALHAEVRTETDVQCTVEEGRPDRVRELADALKNEDRARRAEEFFQREDEHFALRDADYLAFADSEDRARIDSENIEKRRLAFFEEQRNVKAQADAELQAKLDADREAKAKAALASWVPM